jgi:hypothetical protein
MLFAFSSPPSPVFPTIILHVYIFYKVKRVRYFVVVFPLFIFFDFIWARWRRVRCLASGSPLLLEPAGPFLPVSIPFFLRTFSIFPYELYCTTYNRTFYTVNLCLVSIKYKNPYWTYILVLENTESIYFRGSECFYKQILTFHRWENIYWKVICLTEIWITWSQKGISQTSFPNPKYMLSERK